MGLSYRNVVLREATQVNVVAYLTPQEWHGVVSPTVEGITVVCPERLIFPFEPMLIDGLDDEVPMRFVELVPELSRELHCIALGIDVRKEDRFRYWLIDNGVMEDYYVSPGIYVTEETIFLPINERVIERVRPPRGGDAMLLCRKFKALETVNEVAAILSEDSPSLKYIFQSDRHRDLIGALGLPDIAYLEVIGARGKSGFVSL